MPSLEDVLPDRTFTRLSSTELIGSARELAAVLVDAVEDGASVGFVRPLDLEAAATWWEGLAAGVTEGALLVWAAHVAGRLCGTVQLKLERTPNGRHRAEIAKLMVHRDARGGGLGRRLLVLAEQAAVEAGATLLLLDTQTGSAAEALYRSAGWTEAGVIPDYAVDPGGVLRATTLFYKQVGRATPPPEGMA
jgi:ribosomal protein S18 acetylase RimI-like enzyme